MDTQMEIMDRAQALKCMFRGIVNARFAAS
jgi:hypothetical protein